MNDPGFDAPLEEMNEEVERRTEEEKKKKQTRNRNSNDEIHKSDDQTADRKLEEAKSQNDEILPSRYWMLSTAAPLTAATLAPIANVMSINALVYPWRVFIPAGQYEGSGTRIEDPRWALAVNGISLISGVAANVILLLNLAKRVSPTWAEPVNIGLWYLSSTLLTVLLIIYSKTSLRLTPRSEYADSQAFYYGIIAASLYAFISTLLVANLCGSIMGKYDRHFKLTISQRTLMLQTMALMCWICLGAGVFSSLEGWTYLDGIYYADVTLLTVGLGDFSPSTNAGRALLFPYASIGIVTLGLVVGSIRGLVVERAKIKVKRRMLEREREKIVGDNANDKNELTKAAREDKQSSEDQFQIMRIIQKKANDRRKWMSLSVSVTCFAFFWLMGAFVFYKAENRYQGWTYFQSLYFAFTSLITIGYGDFTPESNSGRPFFVIWSLLAVPTLTILISNMGDTIIAGIKDFTLWLGEWTILPEEVDLKSALKSKKKDVKWITKSPAKKEEQKKKEASESNDGDGGNSVDERLQHEAQSLVDEEESDSSDSDDENGSRKSQGWKTEHQRNKNLHHRLALALQKLLPDLVCTPPKQYTYAEWSQFLELVNMPDGQDAEEDDDKGNGEAKINQETDWLAEDSPLMSRSTETEWLVKRLCERLEECLREKKREKGEDPGNKNDEKNNYHGGKRNKNENGGSIDKVAKMGSRRGSRESQEGKRKELDHREDKAGETYDEADKERAEEDRED